MPVEMLQPPGLYGVRDAESALSTQRQGVKESMRKYPQRPKEAVVIFTGKLTNSNSFS